jgi:hypothetical protein
MYNGYYDYPVSFSPIFNHFIINDIINPIIQVYSKYEVDEEDTTVKFRTGFLVIWG